MRILIVGEDGLNNRELADLLTALGETVIGAAANGQQGLEQARAVRPDVVFMDVNLSDMSGFETTVLIKAEMPGVRVVLLTSSLDDPDFAARSLRCGADGHLLKVPTKAALEAVLDGLRLYEPTSPRDIRHTT